MGTGTVTVTVLDEPPELLVPLEPFTPAELLVPDGSEVELVDACPEAEDVVADPLVPVPPIESDRVGVEPPVSEGTEIVVGGIDGRGSDGRDGKLSDGRLNVCDGRGELVLTHTLAHELCAGFEPVCWLPPLDPPPDTGVGPGMTIVAGAPPLAGVPVDMGGSTGVPGVLTLPTTFDTTGRFGAAGFCPPTCPSRLDNALPDTGRIWSAASEMGALGLAAGVPTAPAAPPSPGSEKGTPSRKPPSSAPNARLAAPPTAIPVRPNHFLWPVCSPRSTRAVPSIASASGSSGENPPSASRMLHLP